MKNLIRIIGIGLIIMGMYSCKKAIVQPINLGNEIDFSSPIIPLGDSWQGTMGGLLDVQINYDNSTNRIYGTVKNISNKKLCWALSEPHMKLLDQTVGELGPEMLGDLLPGEQVSTSLTVGDDPRYTGYKFDGYVIHLEVYDCSAGTPLPYPNGV